MESRLLSAHKRIFLGGFVYAVRGKLAEVLSEFNLGEKGGLVPFNIIQDDVKTPLDGKYFYLNWDGHKDTFLPEKSQNVELFSKNVEKGIERWQPTLQAQDGDIALSHAALVGADLWIERRMYSKLFMSDGLVNRLREAKIKIDFRLMECRIVEAS